MEFLWPLATYAFVSSITPGPNNIMLTSSGIWFGFIRSIPHMLGITCGFAVLLAICAAGIGSLVMAVPAAHVVLKVGGSGYLLYLAWQLRSMGAVSEAPVAAKPMSFTAAAMFQFANPKAWMMAITGAAAFLPSMRPTWLAIAVYCLVFSVVNLPCVSVWAGAGSLLRRFLTQALWRKLFSAVMVLLTIYAALSIWL
ncbi:threonine/homoserine/homoserine lactone efflux protein [Herbaspirillum sp. Sphag1AN]|uniref:LysE family translocator n=1 Tax=unclassified Herbaspirillum TaxID=2624150 RepID=UPI001615B4C0|nr:MULTISPECIES: LysE family translocator [unclassified Herbaspirillum]MBB3211705.1 threonine/homoserine/homoserine lactone efflux protein [Herbaspirillum sp. Sphag1AN]MBB3245027.1 threonine/homoserine/homoserine lactone efflux protein [Herbaspirillum sp. Sphag64]